MSHPLVWLYPEKEPCVWPRSLICRNNSNCLRGKRGRRINRSIENKGQGRKGVAICFTKTSIKAPLKLKLEVSLGTLDSTNRFRWVETWLYTYAQKIYAKVDMFSFFGCKQLKFCGLVWLGLKYISPRCKYFFFLVNLCEYVAFTLGE